MITSVNETPLIDLYGRPIKDLWYLYMVGIYFRGKWYEVGPMNMNLNIFHLAMCNKVVGDLYFTLIIKMDDS